MIQQEIHSDRQDLFGKEILTDDQILGIYEKDFCIVPKAIENVEVGVD